MRLSETVNEPFRQRVADAWKEFSRVQSQLLKTLSRGSSDSPYIISPFVDALYEVHTQYQGTSQGRFQLTFRVKSYLEDIFALESLCRGAPEEVRWDWMPVAGADPMSIHVPVGNTRLSETQVRVRVEQLEEGTVCLRLFCRAALPLLASMPEETRNALIQIVRSAMGEIPFLTLVREVVVAEEDDGGSWIALKNVLDTLSRMGCTVWRTGEDYVSRRITRHYTPLEESTAQAGLRTDVYLATGCFPDPGEAFARGETFRRLDVWHSQGITAGFFFFPVQSLEEYHKGDQGEMMAFCRAAEKGVEDAGVEAVQILCVALGREYAYIDVLAWDPEATLKAVRSFFSGGVVDWVCFHPFYPAAGPIPVWRKDPSRPLPWEGQPEPEPEPVRSPEEIARWIRNDMDSVEILSAIRQLPPEQWTFPLALFQAKALVLRALAWGDSAAMEQAEQILHRWEGGEESRSSGEYFVLKAICCLREKRLPEARTALEQADVLTPDLWFLPSLKAFCDAQAIRPRLPAPGGFRRRVIRTWDRFLKQEESLRRRVGEDCYRLAPAQYQEIVLDLTDIFQDAVEDVAVTGLYMVDGRVGVNFLPIDLPHLYAINQMMHSCPEEVLDYWIFSNGAIPGITPLRTGLFSSIRPDDFLAWIQKSPEPDVRADLVAACPKLVRHLNRIGAMDMDQYALAMYTAIFSGVGGFICCTSLRHLEIVTTPPDGNGIPMEQVPDRLKLLGVPLYEPDEAFFQREVPPEVRTPAREGPAVAGLRSDILTQSSRMPVLIDSYLQGKAFSAPVWKSGGIRCGFFFFPLGDVPGEEDRDVFCTRVQEAIWGAGRDVVTILGTARGTTLFYVDVIAWDCPCLLAYTSLSFRSTPLTRVWFQYYDSLEDPIPLDLTGESVPAARSGGHRKGGKKKGKRRR